MTIRQYWVHYDEPLSPPTPEPHTGEPQRTGESQPATEGWEQLFSALLDIVEPHPGVYRQVIHLLSGVLAQIPRQFTPT